MASNAHIHICAERRRLDTYLSRKQMIPMKWECSSECKPLMETEVDAIVSLRAVFENPMQEDATCLRDM